MIHVRIAGQDRQFRDDLSDLDESWVNQQVNRRKADGQQVCVQVEIQVNSLGITLSTPACASGGGLGRPLTPQEHGILELWRQHGLSSLDFDGGQVVAFLKRLRKYL